MRVLVVEDDPALGPRLAEELRRRRYVVDLAGDGEEGRHLGSVNDYVAAVLDIGLPVVDGLAVLAAWRAADRRLPVLLLTARDSWQDKVIGLRAGADDYLGKPFATEELVARLEALVRRGAGQAATRLRHGALEIDLAGRSVARDGAPVALTPTEYRALAYLAVNRGRVISKTELTEHLYDQLFEHDSNVIEAVVARLRRKLGASAVQTRRGHGYLVE
ncbi:MAG: response regulator transcription factor [Pseudomonadota bacterium]